MQDETTESTQSPTVGASAGELPQSLAECHVVIVSQAQQLSVLQAQMSVLQERLKLDSNNSSKPPSSNGPGQRNRAQRRASERSRGAQPGHKGHYRALWQESRVDQIIDCKPEPVCECGQAMTVEGDPIQHQVFEVPVVAAQVNEYRLYSARCKGCGKAHSGRLPAGVPKGQLGPRALALVGMLGTRYHLTQGKIRNLLDEVLGVSFSIGAISQAHGKVAQALIEPAAEVSRALVQAPVKCMDETRYPREGGGNWVWVVHTPKLVSFALLPSRARYVAQSLTGAQAQGTVVSDRYSVYDYVDVQQRQVCWAHLLRDFTRISERAGLAGRIGATLLGAGYLLFRWRNQERAEKAFAPLQRRMERALKQGAAQTQCSRTAATCANVLKLWPALWAFLDNPDVPPTNNDAERALRAVVIKRKISGPTRSRRGDEFIARGFTASESCLRQGRHLWDYLHQAMLAWIDKTPAPSLLPAPTG